MTNQEAIKELTYLMLCHNWTEESYKTGYNISEALQAGIEALKIQSNMRYLTSNMRYLTPEENKELKEIYNKMSTVVSGINFFDDEVAEVKSEVE